MARRLVAAVLAIPLIVATAAMLAVVVREQWLPSSVKALTAANSAEAAAEGDAAEVLHLMRLGSNPNQVYPLRGRFISPDIVRATTLEAAMWSGRLEMMRLLDREGAIVGESARHELACLASDLERTDVALYLGAGAMPACEPGAARARLVARSAREEAR